MHLSILRSSTFKILAAIVFGLILGHFFPEVAQQFSIVGKVLLQLIKALATPLVFLVISEAMVKQRLGSRDFMAMLGLSLVNAVFALTIGLGLANAFHPGSGLAQLVNKSAGTVLGNASFAELFLKQIPASIVQPFVDNNILATVILAILFGLALKKIDLGEDPTLAVGRDRFVQNLALFRAVLEKVLGWVVSVMPLAVFASIAQVTATQGAGAFVGLIRYTLFCLLGMGLHSIFVYLSWVRFYAGMRLRDFFRQAMEPIVFAFGINSSLITLPLTLKALDKLGVSRRISTLVAVIGTNFNNDGIVLYEVFTLLAITQAYGMDLGIYQQILLALFCLVASLGVSGIPEAGIVALSLVLSSLSLPTEIIGLLLSVDWLLARTRSAVNACGDMAGSIVLQRWESKVYRIVGK